MSEGASAFGNRFFLEAKRREQKMTKIKMQGPLNFGGFSHGGVSHAPDDDGCFDCEPEAVSVALSHGCAVWVEPEEDQSGLSDEEKADRAAKTHAEKEKAEAEAATAKANAEKAEADAVLAKAAADDKASQDKPGSLSLESRAVGTDPNEQPTSPKVVIGKRK